jgi:hypothetical protein
VIRALVLYRQMVQRLFFFSISLQSTIQPSLVSPSEVKKIRVCNKRLIL